MLLDYFSENISMNKLPSKEKCTKFIDQTGINRNWVSVKSKINNELRKMAK